MNRRQLVSSVVAAIPLSWVGALAHADPSPAEAALIESLIQEVAAEHGIVFIRNGSEGTPDAAAKHLRDKYAYFRKDIVTADDFIRLCGTRSELTKQPYQVRLPDGTSKPAAEWLHGRLAALRSKAK